ncbi:MULTISPECIES: CHAD domain-containing protein [unclassified Exiguobacterium]|uniref:CHAD domain-containing protein n=1 Tax=unclassified Exiguobacterium TaxID=2644629 RepID=UPI001BEA5AE5|nr:MULTISPECIES: CHAD domain-containing protein [unclassified Exiguobacterium]
MNQRHAEKLKFELLETWNTFNHYVTEALTFNNSEDIHRARVHLRKLITFMQIFETKPATFRQLKQLMEALGNVRDLDVLVEQFDAETNLDEAFLQAMEKQRAIERTILSTRVSEKMTPSLDQQIRRFIGGPLFRAFKKTNASPKLEKAKSERKQRIRIYHEQTNGKDQIEALHKVRLAVKRERYLHEYLLNYESDASMDTVRTLKKMQTELGEMNDHDQLLKRWRSFTPPVDLQSAYDTKIKTLQHELDTSVEHLTI